MVGELTDTPNTTMKNSNQKENTESTLKPVVDRYDAVMNCLVEKAFVPYGTTIAFLTYAFVFFYYGFLKVQALATGLTTPVRAEVGEVVSILGLPELGISLTAIMVFIGLYETVIGTLFALKRIRAVFFLFLIHQLGTFVTLILGRTAYFKKPFLAGVFPWLFDTFAAYILKNTIFVGGFLVLAALELGRRYPETTTGANRRSDPSNSS
jgi:hypothetical protein